MIEHPKMDFDSILQSIGFKKISKEEIESKLPMLKAKFMDGKQEISKTNMRNWVIGQVRKRALGNVDLSGLSKLI